MKHKAMLLACVIGLVSVLGIFALVARAQEPQPQSVQVVLGTAFTYQGQLKKNNSAVNDVCAMTFSVWDALTSGGQLGSAQIINPVTVTNGLFTAQLNGANQFGASAFNGQERWLQIAVQCAGDGSPIMLARQQLTAAPYALYAVNSGSTNALQGRTITTTAPTTGQVLKWNGSAWSPASDSVGTGGAISTVVAGNGLTGGGTSSTVTLTVNFAGNGSAPTVARSDHNHDASYWNLNGNSGATVNNFIGTTDNMTFTVRVSNTNALRIVPNTTSPNLIGGYSGNVISSTLVGATIAGGGNSGNINRITDNYGAIGGGRKNQAGNGNTTSNDAPYATVGGGNDNTASGSDSTVGGGTRNTASGSSSTIAGGQVSTVLGDFATVGGGFGHAANGTYSFIGGGSGNTIGSDAIIVSGQVFAAGDFAAIGGGAGHTADGDYSFIGGGSGNTILITATYATIGGGIGNTAAYTYATVGGGNSNLASGSRATVSGGDEGVASGDYATVGGGNDNTASGAFAVVGGGTINLASGTYATVGGGQVNTASGSRSVVSGGGGNTASGAYAVVPGGNSNIAQGDFSLAAGYNARALHSGSFVWGDYSLLQVISSTTTNQFIIRATNGVGIGTNSPDTQLHVVRAINSTATPANHVALIENTANGNSADVLALKIGYTGTPLISNNFVTFFDGNNASVGSLEGNGAGSVQLSGAGNDYAEWLPRLHAYEAIERGDIVGVFNGRVTKRTHGASQVMVVSTGPIVAGNDPGAATRKDHTLVAFIGQASVRVRGAVQAGDFIAPSGLNDGTGIAVAPEHITMEQFAQVVGQAWESAAEVDVKSVRVAIGLIRHDPTVQRLVAHQQAQAEQLTALDARVTKLEAMLNVNHTNTQARMSVPVEWLIIGALLVGLMWAWRRR
jgi:hypothetical protein